MGLHIMHFISIIILQIVCMPNFSLGGGCPDSTTLGPRTQDGSKSLCAIVYESATNHEDTSCTGRSKEVYVGEENGNLGDFNDIISSMVVREGCELEGYWRDDFGGDHKHWTGYSGNLDHDHIGIGDWEDDISSYKCSCIFNAVDCEATDEWTLLQACDNDLPEGSANVVCKYTESHGLEVGASITNGGSIGGSMGLSLGEEFAFVFRISPEFNTEYNWEKSQEFSESYTVGREVDFEAQPGQHVGAYQINGICDDTNVGTVCYKVMERNTKEVLRSDCPNLQ